MLTSFRNSLVNYFKPPRAPKRQSGEFPLHSSRCVCLSSILVEALTASLDPLTTADRRPDPGPRPEAARRRPGVPRTLTARPTGRLTGADGSTEGSTDRAIDGPIDGPIDRPIDRR